MFELHTQIQTPRGETIKIDTEFNEVDGLFQTHGTHSHQTGEVCFGRASSVLGATQMHLNAIKHGFKVSWIGSPERPVDGKYH